MRRALAKWLVGLGALAPMVAVALVWETESGSAVSVVVLNPAHDCTFCHGLHGAVGDQLLNDTTVEAVCLGCHGPARPDTTVPLAEVHTNDPTGNSCCDPFRVTCRQCHDPHSNQANRLGPDSFNLKLILSQIETDSLGTRDVIFMSRGVGVGGTTLYSFCDDDEDNNGIWDQICDVCHANADLGRHHYDGTANHHQNGATCTRSGCHEHGNALNP